ncbi:hypothetical protein C8R45DRAFT_1100374 [Mycena sanguinolenta]|nr:hypothetical protein C8R45DRAFT_1100374 [Mycena sanguinolenta]
MAPIRLKSWVPRNTKPTWDWKAKNSAELEHFTVPFAFKEYVQNIVGQILKDLEVREWNDWTREDLRKKSIGERADRKSKDCLPLYILSANIPIPSKTNLMAAIVLWSTGGSRNAVSFINNHLDDDASFDSFAIDGESTSKANKWAVGEKGKGAEYSPGLGLSFRVGEQIGELKWKTSRKVGSEDSLRVILDDLTTRTVEQYLPHRYLLDIDNAFDGGEPDWYNKTMETAKMREKAANVLKQGAKRRLQLGLDGPDGKSVATSDEVCITIVGIAPNESDPEYLFSAIFGIIPPSSRWRSPGSPVEFFLHGKYPRFYHRDQHVPHGLHLNKLSISYHGDLFLSSERIMVLNDRVRIPQYRRAVCNAIHLGFQTQPDLAVEIIDDLLTDDHSDGLAGILIPPNKDAATGIRTAFEKVCRRKISTSLELHPRTSLEKNLSLFSQLGLEPVVVTPRVLEILHQSGAYMPVNEYARKRLLESPPIPDFSGLDRVRDTLRKLLPSLPSENISVRQYDNLYPSVVWDEKHNLFALARPKPCEDHPAEECLCWVGPALHDIAKEYKGNAISLRKLWRAFAVEMGGDTTIKRPPSATPMDTCALLFSLIFNLRLTYVSFCASGRIFTLERIDAVFCNITFPGSSIIQSVTTSKQPYKVAASTGLSAPPNLFSAPNPFAPRVSNNPPRAPDNQPAAPSNGTQSTAVSNPGGTSSAPPQPPQSKDETAANKAALAQLSKLVFGFDPVQKYDEVVGKLED